MCGVRFSRRAGSTTPLGVPSSRTPQRCPRCALSMYACDGRVRAAVFGLDARLAKVRSPPGQLRPAISVFRFLLANGCEVRPSRWCPMCTAAWPIQRARPRPRPCPLWPFDPSRRLKTTPRFWQQIRPHARTIAPTHKRTLTHASTPPATRADALANASRKHTHAQTPRRRKSPTRTNATRTAHAPTNARTDANDTPRGCDKCPCTRVHAYQHATCSNTLMQHLKVL